MNLRNPFDTSHISNSDYKALRRSAIAAERYYDPDKSYDADEVMSIDNIRDRAFKLANELLGAYDQVSETGKALRDLLMPFYSWMEVNAKRYWQLLKNGITEDVAGDFASKYLKGQIANIPYFSYKIGKTLLFINLFSILLQAFNKLFWPEDEEKLPPEIAGRPHITLGHDSEGNVLYFSQVGSLFDWLEWAGLDTFKHDVKQIFNGQLTVTDWLKHMASSPFNKIINGLNPFLKTPFEIGSGMSFYPSVTKPRIIRDRLKYLAQSFGLAWPYKALTGEPRNNWHEFRNLFIYSQDAEQAAYFYILNLVNQFREKELGETFSGFQSTKRSNALRNFKTALRFKDNETARRSLNEYFQLGGKRQSLNTSIRNMHPLHSLNAKNKAKFLDWLSDEDKKFLESAEKYYQKQVKQFEEVISGGNRQNKRNEPLPIGHYLN